MIVELFSWIFFFIKILFYHYIQYMYHFRIIKNFSCTEFFYNTKFSRILPKFLENLPTPHLSPVPTPILCIIHTHQPPKSWTHSELQIYFSQKHNINLYHICKFNVERISHHLHVFNLLEFIFNSIHLISLHLQMWFIFVSSPQWEYRLV